MSEAKIEFDVHALSQDAAVFVISVHGDRVHPETAGALHHAWSLAWSDAGLHSPPVFILAGAEIKITELSDEHLRALGLVRLQ